MKPRFTASIQSNMNISHLAPETLLAIFLWRRDNAAVVHDYRSWIPEVTHICQYWRKHALSCTALWCMPDMSFPDLASKMLARSGSHPLSIRFEWNAMKSLKFLWSTLDRENDRIHHLDLSIPPTHISHLIKQASRPAPLLESIRLSQPMWRTTMHRSVLFTGNMPNLRGLSISDYSVDLIRLSNVRLVGLSISFGKIPSEYSVAYMHSVLRLMPCLQEITFWDAIAESVTPPGDHDPSAVHLPSLRYLSVIDTAPNMAALLLPLRCSSTELDSMHFGDIDGASPLAASVCRWIASNCRVLTGLRVDIRSAWISAYRRDAPPGCPAAGALVIMPTANSHAWLLLEATLHALDLARVASLTFTCELDFTDDDAGPLPQGALHRIYLQTPNITILRLEGPSVRAALAALIQAEYIIPRLRHLVIRGAVPLDVRTMQQVLLHRLPDDDAEAVARLSFHDCGAGPPRELMDLLVEGSRLRVRWDDQIISATAGRAHEST